MNGCIAVFAKTPELSPVKTRLAATIGKAQAEEIYAHCIDAVQSVLENIDAPDWDIKWVLAEEAGSQHDFWQDRPYTKEWTGAGDLGERLYHVYSGIKRNYDHAIVMGTDSPQISKEIIQEAIDKVSSGSNVIGPAHDGGYYLFGSSENINKEIWTSVPYSSGETRRVFVENLNKDVVHLKELSDLDVEDDISTILAEMPDQKTAAQAQLIQLLEKL